MREQRENDRLNLLEAAPIVGVSPYTLRAWIRQRRIPFYRVGRRVMFSRQELEGFMDRHRVDPVREKVVNKPCRMTVCPQGHLSA